MFGFLLLVAGSALSQDIYIGTTMGFTDYLENHCGIVFKENGVPADPFESIANHGATIVRLRIDLPPFASSYSEGEQVDHKSVENVKTGLQRAKDAGLNTVLTFRYHSFALEDSMCLNPYVAPLAWQPIASDLDKLTDSVYNHTYSVLDEYCSEGLIPQIVSIGNESSWHRLMPNVPEDELPAYDPARSVALHNAGSKAVRDIAVRYDTTIKVCFHMMGPSVTKWWLETHWPFGPDLDMMGISLYHGLNNDDYAGYSSVGEYFEAMIHTYGIEFIVMETAQLFTEGGIDGHVDILGIDNIPPGYSNPPTTETQRNYLIDLTRDVLDHGGSGVLVWGGEWVASDCYIYADRWGRGSSWENKAFWDFNYNLQDGMNWMMEFTGKIRVKFKVDMSDADTSNGIFISGDFENFRGETWAFNRMQHEGNKIYYFTAYIDPGTTGEFYFLNDTSLPARETVPGECAIGAENKRLYDVPLNSSGEIFAFVWSACDSVPQYNLTTDINGKGSVSPVTGVYSSGIRVSMEARPGLGWEFIGWTGDTTDSANTIEITMNSDKHLTANFSKKPDVPLTFKVDMTGVDASKGVYVTGEFPDHQGKIWQLNRMYLEGGNIYSYSTYISVGSTGAYYFLNDDQWGIREIVPAECAVHFGGDRGFEIPYNSTGETYAYAWSSCSEIPPASVPELMPGSDNSFVQVYPNPVLHGKLNLSFRVADNVIIRILDLPGNILSEKRMKVTADGLYTINLGSFSEGAYLLMVFFTQRNAYQSRVLLIQDLK